MIVGFICEGICYIIIVESEELFARKIKYLFKRCSRLLLQGVKKMSVKTVENMVEWVEENIENEPTLEKMAEEMGYSKFYCSAKFHQYVGMSYKEYVFKRKLALAADLLLKTDDRLIDIAVKYGFSSHEAFTRAFRKNYGYSPSHFRINRPSIRLHEKIRLVEFS